jgi:hypothetical protein
LAAIAGQLRISIPRAISTAIQECFAKHVVVPARPETPEETVKDKSYRECISRIAAERQISVDAVRRNIANLNVEELNKKYQILPEAVPGFKKHVTRTA